MPTTWTTDNKFKLMLAIMQVKSPSPPDWNEVAKLLGPSVTVEACKQQYKAIKKIADKDIAIDPATTTPQTTPRKRKAQPTDSAGESNPTPTMKKVKSIKVEKIDSQAITQPVSTDVVSREAQEDVA